MYKTNTFYKAVIIFTCRWADFLSDKEEENPHRQSSLPLAYCQQLPMYIASLPLCKQWPEPAEQQHNKINHWYASSCPSKFCSHRLFQFPSTFFTSTKPFLNLIINATLFSFSWKWFEINSVSKYKQYSNYLKD